MNDLSHSITEASGYLKRKPRQVLAKCTGTALDSLKKKLFFVYFQIPEHFVTRMPKCSEFRFNKNW